MSPRSILRRAEKLISLTPTALWASLGPEAIAGTPQAAGAGPSSRHPHIHSLTSTIARSSSANDLSRSWCSPMTDMSRAESSTFGGWPSGTIDVSSVFAKVYNVASLGQSAAPDR